MLQINGSLYDSKQADVGAREARQAPGVFISASLCTLYINLCGCNVKAESGRSLCLFGVAVQTTVVLSSSQRPPARALSPHPAPRSPFDLHLPHGGWSLYEPTCASSHGLSPPPSTAFITSSLFHSSSAIVNRHRRLSPRRVTSSPCLVHQRSDLRGEGARPDASNGTTLMTRPFAERRGVKLRPAGARPVADMVAEVQRGAAPLGGKAWPGVGDWGREDAAPPSRPTAPPRPMVTWGGG